MKAKLIFTAAVSRLCIAILAFLGYSCENNGGDMYGTPTGTWEIKGEVTDEEIEPVTDATVKVTLPNVSILSLNMVSRFLPSKWCVSPTIRLSKLIQP